LEDWDWKIGGMGAMPVLALQEKPSSADPTGGAANATQNATQKNSVSAICDRVFPEL
jgi:hypothetical protein